MDVQRAASIAKFAAAGAAAEEALASAKADRANALTREKAAQEFASLLFLEVLKAMRVALPQEGLFENESLSRDIYTAMMDAEIAKAMAKRDTTGFVKMVENSLAKHTSSQTHGGIEVLGSKQAADSLSALGVRPRGSKFSSKV